jgi:hypothetical protein
MKHYQKPDGSIWAFEDDGSQDALIAPDMVPVAAPVPAPDVVSAVPQIVTMRQARRALFGAGLLSGVEAAIEALPEPQRTAARIEWDYSSEVHRNRPFVQTLAGTLNLTPEQLDALFTQAAQL